MPQAQLKVQSMAVSFKITQEAVELLISLCRIQRNSSKSRTLL